MLAVMNENAVRGMTEKAKATHAVRIARGDVVGQAPYGYRLAKVDGIVKFEPDPDRPMGPIIEAFERAGGRTRTAVRIINDELKIPSPYGRRWDRISLLRIIEREAPHLRAPKAPSGRRESVATPALLAKVLRCHCGATMTPNRHLERRRTRDTLAVSYYCGSANAAPQTHGSPYYVAESKLLAWIKAEAARLTPPDEVRVAEDDADRRAKLVEKRRRLALTFADQGIDETTWKAETRKVRDELEALDAASRAVPILQPVDWENWTVSEINTVLRAIFAYVQLGRDLLPVEAVWNYRAWRSDLTIL
jgi:hypothetical protein